jgi:elongation factor P
MAADLPGLAQQIAHFESRLQVDPGSRAFLALADLYRRAGKFDRARQLLSEGLKAHPGFVSARVVYGDVLMSLGDLTAARVELQAVLARDPDNILALQLLVRDAASRREWRTACELAERLLRLQPEAAEVRTTLRKARSELAQRSQAARPARPTAPPPTAAAAEEPAGVLAIGNGFETPTLADLYRRQGHPEKARAILERILAAEPDRTDALEVLARLDADEAPGSPAPKPPPAAQASQASQGSAPEPVAAEPDAAERAAERRGRNRPAAPTISTVSAPGSIVPPNPGTTTAEHRFAAVPGIADIGPAAYPWGSSGERTRAFLTVESEGTVADTSDFRTGFTMRHKGDLWSIMEFQHVKPGKGGAFVRTRLRGVTNGKVIDETFRAGEKVEEVRLEKRDYQYLYNDGEDFTFMNVETYEQIQLPADMLGDLPLYVKESDVCSVLLFEEKPLTVEPPFTVELAVKQTDPGFKGDTAQGGSKPATMETGLVVQVPLFIEEGSVLKIDTRTGKYLGRA